MPISDRIESTVERWSTKWKERLKGWLSGTIGFGIEVFLDVLGKKQATLIKPLIEKAEQSGKIPPEIAAYLQELKSPTGEAAGAGTGAVASAIVGGSIGRIIDAIMLPLAYAINGATRNVIINVDQMIRWYLMGKVDRATVDLALAQHGLSKDAVDIILDLALVRFPSDIVAPAWLRDKAKYEKYWNDVRGLGITEDRIELLKELAYQMPSARDVVSFLAHEVFEPKMIAKYGLDDEWGELDKTMFEKVGLKETMALNYWRDHWQHASWSQVMEMLHRGAISEQDVYDWFRLVEIPPYWRTNLTKVMYSLPGRIEVRMMAQYGLVDKAKIMELLEKDGLAKEYLESVADMNLVRGVRTDIQTRYTKKWIDSAGVKAEIDKLGLKPPMPERLYQWIVSNAKPERTAAEKDLTVAQICKAVKRGDIPWDDGIQRLMAQGYDEEEADLIMTQSVEVVEVEPTTELNVSVDTIRRQRRQRLFSRDQEIAELLRLGIDTGLAIAYADNDDMRLVKEVAPKPPEIIPEYLTDDGKVKVETIRVSRRQRLIARNEEITSLMALEMSSELAISYADHDELRLAVVKPVVVPPIILFYQTDVGKVQLETIRLTARQRKLTRAQTAEEVRLGKPPVLVTGDEAREREIDLLMALEMSEELATAYAENDELRLVKETTGGA